MKKIFLYIMCIISLAFVIPVVFVAKFSISAVLDYKTSNEQEKNYSTSPYCYNEYGTIKLLNTDTNEVVDIDLDEYLLRSCVSRNAC